MKTTEELKKYQTMDEKALEAELLGLKKRIANDTLKVKAGKLADFSSISKTKRNIARLSTIINEKKAE